jgi:hypothetical protein
LVCQPEAGGMIDSREVAVERGKKKKKKLQEKDYTT